MKSFIVAALMLTTSTALAQEATTLPSQLSVPSVQLTTPLVVQPVRYNPPPSGTPFLVVGGIFTGLGAMDLGIGIAYAEVTSASNAGFRSDRDYQVELGEIVAVVGGVQLLAGVIMLTVGLVERTDYNVWKVRHRWVSGMSPSGYSFRF